MNYKKQRSIILILFSFICINAYSQKVVGITDNKKELPKDTIPLQILDNAQFRIFYSLSFVKDTTNADLITDCQTLLLVGSKYSAFLDYNTLRKDSIYNTLAKTEGVNSMSLISQTMTIGKQIQFTPILIKDYPEKGVCTFQQMITAKDNYRYKDKDITLDWNLCSGEKKIQEYTCKKATCIYRGREYTAWYCPDIALSEGPYVFKGLPGLILEIYDNKEHYRFSLNGLYKSEDYNPIYLPANNIVNSSRENVRKIISNLKANPASILQMMGGKAKVSEDVLKKLQPKPYNPIELE